MTDKFLTGILLTIVARLKQARRARALTQKSVADKLGVAQSYIAKMETGKVDFPISRLVELARVLDFEVVLVPKKKLAVVEAVIKEHAAETAADDAATTGSQTSDTKRLLGIEDIE